MSRLWPYIKTLLWSLKKSNRHAFDHVNTYCMFVGYPRSGHSFVGSLLDAHPNMIISHELDALSFLRRGFQWRKIFSLILMRSRLLARTDGLGKEKLKPVPNQWNGRFRELLVIGDKKGGRSTRILLSQPELFDLLLKVMPVPVKFIHIVRNPFDNVATIEKRSVHTKRNTDEAIDYYQLHLESITTLKDRLPPESIIDIRHEDLILDSQRTLGKICTFLGLSSTNDYLSDCEGRIFKKPNLTRMNINWTPGHKQRVEQLIKQHAFLASYSFEQ